MSDSNRGQLSYIKESVWGTIPASALTDLRTTDEDFGHNVETLESKEVRSDRQVTDQVLVGAEAFGGFGFELSYESPPDELLAGALFGAFVGVGGGAVNTITSGAAASNLDFSLSAVGNTITLGSAVTHSITAGQWIRLEGSTADNGYHLVTDVSGNVLTVEALTTTEVLDETDLATITGSKLINGTTVSSFTIQRELADKAKFFAFRGQMVNELSMAIAAKQMVTGRLAFMGGTVLSTDFSGTSFGTGSNVVAPTNDVLNAAANVGQVREGGTLLSATTFVQTVNFTLNNNLRGNAAVGIVGNASVGIGKCRVTGTMTVLFHDGAFYSKLLAGTESNLSFKFEDAAGNAYVITFPRIKFSAGDTGKIAGEDQEVVENMSFTALRDQTYGYTIEIDKFDA